MQRRRPTLLAVAIGALFPGAWLGCNNWDPSRPFERESPEVARAAALYDGGYARAAATVLEDYLGTGPCREGAIGTPEALGKKREGTFDLGLALFAIGDAYGIRFQSDGKGPEPSGADPKGRSEMVACATNIVRAVLAARDTDYALRAKAHYLEGNLHFLSGDFAQAITAYERALILTPGEPDGGVEAGVSARPSETIGQDAAWNRAIALRRQDDAKDAGPDASPDSGDGGDGGDGGDAGNDAGNDGGNDGGGDAGNDGGRDGGNDGGDSGSKGKDGGGQDAAPQEPDEPDAGDGQGDGGSPPSPPPPQPPPEPQNQNATPDERVLGDLERAPLLQHELSRRGAANRKVRGMADK